MTGLTHFLARVLRGVFALALVLMASVFVLSFLLAALVLVLAASLWSLLTGRKPAPLVMFARMREHSQRYRQRMWPRRPGQPAGDVVDVEVTDVTDHPGAGAPPTTRPDGSVHRLR